MKAILLSIKPEWLSKILNGEKIIEVRKKFPKDYVGWVYLYCTKGKTLEYFLDTSDNVSEYIAHSGKLWDDIDEPLNGKVVARFWCDKVEEITCRCICGEWESYTDTLGYSEISQASCLANKDIVHYLKGKKRFCYSYL